MMYVVMHCRHWERQYAEQQSQSSISHPIPWSGWTCLVQLLQFWQMFIAIYICLIVSYIRVKAWLHNYSHPMCHILSFKLVVHAFSIVCMLAAITTRHMMQMLWQRAMHLVGL